VPIEEEEEELSKKNLRPPAKCVECTSFVSLISTEFGQNIFHFDKYKC
jgi:hypothetical protein